jgi:hypothetical protein
MLSMASSGLGARPDVAHIDSPDIWLPQPRTTNFCLMAGVLLTIQSLSVLGSSAKAGAIITSRSHPVENF